MKQFPKIKKGDYVINKQYDPKCLGLEQYFRGEYKEVVRVENTDWKPDYIGGQIIYVMIEGKEAGFYYNALQKK